MIKGIDVSKHNGSIDFNKVKAEGYDFVIIRAGYGKSITQKDKLFEEHYAGARAAGLDIGVYWYSYAIKPEEAKLEALACLDVIKGKRFEYPIYFDLEEAKQLATGKNNCTALVEAFCSEVQKKGYYVGLYCSRSHLQTHIKQEIYDKYAIWCAEYNSKCNFTSSYGMWQKSAYGQVDGINGNVDLDECYIDYPQIIKATGLNGYDAVSDPAPLPEPKTEAYRVVIECGGLEEAQMLAKLLKTAKVTVVRGQ